MRIIILCFWLFLFSRVDAQYSNYYSINNKLTATVNQNVTGTITSIDYGALALANAQREKNAIEYQKIQDERSRMIAFSIAEDPLKAFEYGQFTTISSKDKKMFSDKAILRFYQEGTGFKNFRIDFQSPSSYLFNYVGFLHLQNKSKEGVATEIFANVPALLKKDKQIFDLESALSSSDTLAGREFEHPDDNGKLRKTFYHKTSLSRATVFGNPGYRNTLIWEDKFEYCITDNYTAYVKGIGDGYIVQFKVRTHGDKNEINFEMLEGRRFYFKQLIDKIISTARVGDLQLLQ
jgi:hypothetical protein